MLDTRHTCIVHQTDNDFLMHEERQALKGLLEPFILGDKVAERLAGERVRWAKIHYQELCLKMARLTLDVKEQNEAFEKLEA